MSTRGGPLVAARLLGAGALLASMLTACAAQDATLAAHQSDVGATPTRAHPKPNILFVLTDDMRLDELRSMPGVRRVIAAKGVTFTRAFSPYPLCCPARASILTGQYPHNHQVMGNDPPLGGIEAFGDKETLPVWLHRTGYRTMLIGKYLNHYNSFRRYIPPGWDDWRGINKGETNYRFWQVNDNGLQLEHNRQYQTDIVAAQARNAILTYGRLPRPFFMYVSLIAPHVGLPVERDDFPGFPSPNVADRHRDDFAGVIPAQPPSFNEVDVSDKPAHVRSGHLVGRPRMVEWWQQRQEALRSADGAVVKFVDALKQIGELDNTIVVFTSDNGFLLGEHRWVGKGAPYEEAIRIPLLVRGPGFRPGTQADQLVSLVDLAPTFVRAAHAHARLKLDGLSLQRIAADPAVAAHRSIVIEGGTDEVVATGPTDGRHRFYWGVRTPADKIFLRYATGEREYYDLTTDPAQLDNSVDSAPAEVRARLSQLLALLRNCVGPACWRSLPPPRGP